MQKPCLAASGLMTLSFRFELNFGGFKLRCYIILINETMNDLN